MARGFSGPRKKAPKRRKVKSGRDALARTKHPRPAATAIEAVDAHERGKDFLSEGEVEELRKAARSGRHGERDDVLILLMYRHGFRVSEAIRLRQDELNLKEARIEVRRLKRGLDVQHPVAGDELRAIKSYLRSRADRLPWLFLSERGSPLTRQAVNYILRVAGEQAGLGRVHPHMLRHGCGYYLANGGYDTRLIQDYLGHRDPRHTARYTRTAARRFEGLWKGR
ncbi:MAG: tyrosine-type recombinase/integrase [Hyphomicrobiaceae bacterium]